MAAYYEFDVVLLHTRRRPWRRIQISADASFLDLHLAIQDATGWWNYHLFRFETPEEEDFAGIPEEDWDDPEPDAADVSLSSYFTDEDRCIYFYDFGDGWEMSVDLIDTFEIRDRFQRRLIGGASAFPHEDSGGVGGYEECVRIARGGPDREGIREWLGDWDPDRFDMDALRAEFDR